MNIIVADTNFIVRFGTISLIKEIKPSIRVYEASSFGNIMDRLGKENIDLIISDVRMKGMESLEFIRKWRTVRPQVKILVFTDYSEEYNALRFIKSGVNGFLSKGSSLSEIKGAILTVLNEGLFVGEIARGLIIKAVLSSLTENVVNPFEQLSMKEKDVLGLLLQGWGSKEIATKLKLKISTVSTYRRRIYTKAGVTSLPDLINKFESHETY